MKSTKFLVAKSAAAIAACAVLSSPALADKAAADACAAELSETGKTIYEAVAENLQPDDKVESKIKSTVKPMVKGGDLSRSDAKAGAKEAKACLDEIYSD